MKRLLDASTRETKQQKKKRDTERDRVRGTDHNYTWLKRQAQLLHMQTYTLTHSN